MTKQTPEQVKLDMAKLLVNRNFLQTEVRALTDKLVKQEEETKKFEVRAAEAKQSIKIENADLEARTIKQKVALDEYTASEYKDLEANKESFQKRVTAKNEDLSEREDSVIRKETELKSKLSSLCRKKDEVSRLLVELEKKEGVSKANQRQIDSQRALLANAEKNIVRAKSDIKKHEKELRLRAESLEVSKKAVQEQREQLGVGNKALVVGQRRLVDKEEELNKRASKINYDEDSYKQILETVDKKSKALDEKGTEIRKQDAEYQSKLDNLRAYEEDLKIREVKARRAFKLYRMLKEGIDLSKGEVVDIGGNL